jgi:hypothetical protein
MGTGVAASVTTDAWWASSDYRRRSMGQTDSASALQRQPQTASPSPRAVIHMYYSLGDAKTSHNRFTEGEDQLTKTLGAPVWVLSWIGEYCEVKKPLAAQVPGPENFAKTWLVKVIELSVLSAWPVMALPVAR